MTTMKETIILDNLSIGYRSKGCTTVVADGITACVRSGELTCLLGANGVGKSTLLRTLSAFQPKLGGSICINGREISGFTDKEMARTVGVVLTDKPDVHNMSVKEMVSMGRSPYTGFWGRCSEKDMQVVDNAMQLTGIATLSHRSMGTLSDGERQKVMIAKALAQQTPVIYLDEPTAFLDYPSKVDTMQLLHRICREMQKTVFLSTHDVELALQIADTIWLMSREEGIVSGTPEDLALDGTLPAFFCRHGIDFNKERGVFDVTYDTTRCIRLTGTDGPRKAMMKKALLRSGTDVSENAVADISIEVTPKEFIVSTPSATKQCATVSEAVKTTQLFHVTR